MRWALRHLGMVLPLCCGQREGIGSDDSLWRPRAHFYFRDPSTGIGFHTNDATGSFYDEHTGTWHAVYDCTPPSWYNSGEPKGGYSWCEASSKDLVHWKQASKAILPEDVACDWANLETGAIAMAPASGELIAIFSAKGNGSHLQGSPEWEHVCAARGGSVNNASAAGILDRPFQVLDRILIENANNGSGFRDPSRAIRLADGYSYVVIGTDAGYNPYHDHDPAAKLAQASLWVNRDSSLLSWEPAGVLLADSSAKFLECPDLFPLGPLRTSTDNTSAANTIPGPHQRYLLLGSETFRRGTRWYIGTLRANKTQGGVGYIMEREASGSLDQGFGTHSMAYYAPRTMAPIRSSDGSGRRVLLGWVRAYPNGRAVCTPYAGHCLPYAAHGTNFTFGDFAAFPRELWLGGAGAYQNATFAQRFVPELSALRSGSVEVHQLQIVLGGNNSRTGLGYPGRKQLRRLNDVLELRGRELEIIVNVTTQGRGCASTNWSASIAFLRSGQHESTSLAIVSSGSERTLLLDRSRSAWNADWPDRSNISALLEGTAVEGSIGLHAYVDRSIVEAIANDATAITARVFPQRNDSTTVAVLLEGFPLNAPSELSSTCTVTADFSAWALRPAG
jgi:sucrose-6-phosphate hydrolase SacC (GH32 family)